VTFARNVASDQCVRRLRLLLRCSLWVRLPVTIFIRNRILCMKFNPVYCATVSFLEVLAVIHFDAKCCPGDQVKEDAVAGHVEGVGGIIMRECL
jgi:hypothetical protein